jgi:hypothetical protein
MTRRSCPLLAMQWRAALFSQYHSDGQQIRCELVWKRSSLAFAGNARINTVWVGARDSLVRCFVQRAVIGNPWQNHLLPNLIPGFSPSRSCKLLIFKGCYNLLSVWSDVLARARGRIKFGLSTMPLYSGADCAMHIIAHQTGL